MQPLAGLKVVDFSTLLPGPLASLMLAEAGAEVVKVERPGHGDESRLMSSSVFAMLNRGKRSLCVDLKDGRQRAELLDVIARADILIEQFRPGVMARSGLGWDAVRKINPRLIYCSITGYGQSGPKASRAGHDLNYLAEAGVLSQSRSMPPVLIADIVGGAYPAVINILLALAARGRDGAGRHMDVAMTDNLYPLMFWDLAQGLVAGEWPPAGQGFFTGGVPRYRLYETADNRMLAVGAVEDRFWAEFCAAIDLPASLRDDRRDPAATAQGVADLVRRHPSDHWRAVFADKDACCSVVEDLEAALNAPHTKSRDLFGYGVQLDGGQPIPALPVAVVSAFRSDRRVVAAPRLGEANGHGNI